LALPGAWFKFIGKFDQETPMRSLRVALFSTLLWPAAIAPAAAQSAVAVPVHNFRFAGTPDAALARLRAAVERCWSDDYDSRVHGLHRQVADVPAAASGGATVRLEWHRVVGEKTAGVLRRAFDVALAPEGGATRVTVLVYGPYSEVGRDVEAWFAGRAQCFERYRPSL
jgi:hypothetical protein